MSKDQPPIDRLRERLGYAHTAAERQVEKGRATIAEADLFQVAYHLGWSKDLFQHAAQVEVYGRILAAIDPENMEEHPGVSFDSIEEHVAQEVNRMARYLSQSTSPTSNLIEQYKLAAWGEIQEMIMNIRKYGETL